ncbi:MAG: hypothetical protein M3294_08760 [Pseudomonadota bacterium]|nr:hypothetical protein [Pseudomonadota bacterium]
MYKELAQYVASKKAVEVSSEAGQSFVDVLREANSRRDILDYDICIGVQDYGRTTRREIGSAADLLLTQPKA